jgi:transposase
MCKALFMRRLTPDEEKELRRLIRWGDDARVVRQAQMIQLSSQGQTPSQIGILWAISGQGVRKIIHRFNREGVAGLADRPRKGRSSKTDDRYVELLKQAVQNQSARFAAIRDGHSGHSGQSPISLPC